MRHLLFLFLSLFVASATASLRAGPWQTVLYFYAYRMERDVFGDNPKIAPGCKGTNSAGGCSFDEFLRYIQGTGKTIKPWKGSTDIGNDVAPEAYHAAEQIRKSGYSNTLNSGRLLPGSFESKATPKMVEILDSLASALDDAKTKFGGSLDHHPMTNTMRNAVTNILDARIADNADKSFTTLEKKYNKDGITSFELKSKTVHREDGDYKALDIDSIVKDADTEELRAFIRTFCANDADTKRHNVAIEAFDKFQKVLTPSCYS